MKLLSKRVSLWLIAGIFLAFLSDFVAYSQTEFLLSPPVFSMKHGFYDAPFILEITSEQTGSQIYYTIDGNAPGSNNGTLYTAPLNISTTSTIRAVCVINNQSQSRITTQTYLFPADIIHQSNNPAGYPATWGLFLSISGIAPADYEMDPEMIADPEFANSAKEALRDLPVISLVTDKDYLFSKSTDPDAGGIYIYTGTAEGMGFGWERPVSFEYFDAFDSVSFQADCGVRIHGGEGRRPEKSPKHSFRLIFRSEYGTSKFNFPLFGNDTDSSFDNIILRAGFGNTWIHWSHSERSMAQYLRDRWTKDSQLAMGHPSSHGIYVHLFINGLYWGIYNPSERMDSDFAESYLGGNEEDYDVIKDYAEAVDGNLTAWNNTMTIANAGLAGSEAYQRMRGNNPDGTRNPAYEPMVDVVSLADYMILNFYGGNWDWDHHNWVAIRNRINPGKGFQFFCWDSEHMVEGVSANILSENNDKCPSRIFQQLRQNEDFRRLFADRVQKFCFNNGALTPSSAAKRWTMRANQIDKAVITESARWGDYRRDVHQWQTTGPFELYTKETHWLPQMNYLLNTYFPNRTNNFLNQLRGANLFPSVNAPVFVLNDDVAPEGTISPGALLTMKSDNGVIYYTTDGSDPVIWQTSPSVSPRAIQYSKPLELNESSHLKARTLYNGEWSATSEQFFIIPENFYDLKITEIHYHPMNEEDTENRELEFIELKNTGTSTLDIGGLMFAGAVRYKFPPETPLRPKEFVVLASNSKGFFGYYGFLPFDEYDGQLDNDGELIMLLSAGNDTICSVFYEDSNGWPEAPDGNGKSLVPIDYNPSGDQNNPELWRESYAEGGSPGKDDIYILLTGTSSRLITIFQNYPNPFRDVTILHYELHEDAFVQLSVINAAGQPIVTLENSDKRVGYYSIEWNGLNGNNSAADNGLYFCRITVRNRTGTSTLTRKIILIR
jgi:hypothetical protein